jgi:hypothetical protein
VFVHEGEFAIVELAVYEFENCYAVSLGVPDMGVERYPDCAGAGPLGCDVGDETYVKVGVM